MPPGPGEEGRLSPVDVPCSYGRAATIRRTPVRLESVPGAAGVIERVLSGPSRIFGALITGSGGLLAAALFSGLPGIGPVLALLMLLVTIVMTVRVGCMAVVLRPETLHVRAAYALSKSYPRSEISEVSVVPTGNWGYTGVCLGLTLKDGRNIRVKAINGYRGSKAVNDSAADVKSWLTTWTF